MALLNRLFRVESSIIITECDFVWIISKDHYCSGMQLASTYRPKPKRKLLG